MELSGGSAQRLRKPIAKINKIFSKGKSAPALNHSSSLSLATESRTVDEVDTEQRPAEAAVSPELPPPPSSNPPTDTGLPEPLPSMSAVQVEPYMGATVAETEPLANTAIQPEIAPVAAPARQPNPDGTTNQAAQPRPTLHTKGAPLWNQALEELKKHHSPLYAALENAMSNIPDSSDRIASDVFEKIMTKRMLKNPETSGMLERLKRWLPSLAAVRGITMAISALDPHKIAPIICASIFFSIDFALNQIEPDKEVKILSALSECSNAIDEWVSFEVRFPRKTHPAIQDEIASLKGSLPDLYLRALIIVSDIEHTLNTEGNESKIRSRFANLTNKFVDWEIRKNELMICKKNCSVTKVVLEDKLSADEAATKVLKWIKKEDDPEPTLGDIKLKVTSKGRYKSYGQWFLDAPEYRDWSMGRQALEAEYEPKRALWIRGSYGTGKTTMMQRVFSSLQETVYAPFGDEDLRVVPYFCTVATSRRPDYETIIRSMSQKLSWMPDFTLAKSAENLHNITQRGLHQSLTTDDWEQLLRELLKCGTDSTKIVFIVDALNECDSTDAERLLEFMSEIMEDCPHVQLLCSSHQHVRVNKWIRTEILHTVDVVADATAEDMKAFINGEIEYLRKKIKEDSIFFMAKHIDLLDSLKQSLNKYAKGMFVWVEIWLKILLPTYNDQRNVQSKEEANKLLKALKSSSSEHNEAYAQLKSGYQRLWDFNVMRSDELRPRLFHLALCSFEPLTLASITHALRIRVEKDSEDELYDEDLTVEQVKRLYSNFLTENLAGKLVFVHDSAKDFVRKLKIQVPVGSESKDVDEFSEKRNHMSAAKLYIEVVKRANHPVWQHVDIDPSKWREFVHIGFSYWFAEYSKWAKLDGKGNILPYIVQYGLRHCSEAAKKRSLSDHLWKDVLHKLVLSPQSAFLYVGLLAKFPFFKWPNIPSVEFRNLIGEYKGHIELFTSHVLAWLEITDDDDTSDSRLPSSKEDPVTDDWLFQQLSKHVLYRGQSTLGTSNFGMTALQIACLTRNNATVKLILKATHYMYGHDNRATMDLLFHDPQFDEAPIIIAIKDRQDDIVRTLLEFEIQHADRTIDDQWEGVPRHSPKVLQWSNRDRGGYTALNLAIRRFDEKSICALLRLAQPRDINFREEISGNTALHVAVRNGFLQLIRDLAEEYNADIEVENGFQQTPCGFAYQRGEVEAMKYLVSKGAAVRLPAAEAGNVEHTSKGGDIWDPSQSRSELNEGESYSGGPAEIPPSTLPHPKSRFNETHHQHHQSGLHRRIRMGQAPRPTVA